MRLGTEQCPGHLDAEGIHEDLCNIGGGVLRRHNAIRSWLAYRLRELTSARIAEERAWPALNRRLPPSNSHPNGRLEEARIDIVVQEEADTELLDVVVASIATTDPQEMARRATEPGRAARQAANRKRKRYEGQVRPFALEDTGRLHPQASRLLRRLVENSPEPIEDYNKLVAELQTVLFSTSIGFQRTARGLRAP